MKNRQWGKLTTNKCKQFCNNWCCPCNDGSTGCYANDFFENLCENSSLAYIYREEEILSALKETGFTPVCVEGHLGEDKTQSDRICFLAKKGEV